MALSGKFSKHLKKEITPILQKSFHGIEKEEILPNSLETSITSIPKPGNNTIRKDSTGQFLS